MLLSIGINFSTLCVEAIHNVASENGQSTVILLIVLTRSDKVKPSQMAQQCYVLILLDVVRSTKAY